MPSFEGIDEIFRSIADHSHVGIWILDDKGTIMYSNEAAAEIWSKSPHVSPDEYHTYKAWDYESGNLINLEDWPAIRAMKSGKPVLDHLMRIERFDGLIKFVLISAIPIIAKNGKFSAVVVMNHDVTELKASEARRDELSRIVSHDLKNPLHAIQMATQLLQGRTDRLGDKDTPDKIRQYLSIINDATHVSLELIRDILDRENTSTKGIRLNYAPFSAGELLRSVRPIYDPLAEHKGLRLEWKVELDKSITADKERISQVISNIVGNAIKFTPSGGEIVVTITMKEKDILFHVKDTGPGIRKENLRRIFEKNFQASDSGGTGLGLYIAQMMVHAHGGQIWAESDETRGSEFYFTLPLSR